MFTLDPWEPSATGIYLMRTALFSSRVQVCRRAWCLDGTAEQAQEIIAHTSITGPQDSPIQRSSAGTYGVVTRAGSVRQFHAGEWVISYLRRRSDTEGPHRYDQLGWVQLSSDADFRERFVRADICGVCRQPTQHALRSEGPAVAPVKGDDFLACALLAMKLPFCDTCADKPGWTFATIVATAEAGTRTGDAFAVTCDLLAEGRGTSSQ